ncbi:hypothetical protein PHISCL_06066 [Aspergillus sclerotialis]|uniref:Uncharacterized protein n=1 Tax=Aspergillus sclerotialis TaxID=2070753 RepID=A0A3A2ZF61_9EURO|nr:hypothetical protein PHISCL_06066 [Aspergillus sclerotialis]
MSEMLLTICNEPDTALFTWVIYGELFHHSISAIYDPPPAPVFPLPTATRYKFFVYCVPDINCFRNTVGFPPWFEDYERTGQDVFQQLSLRVAMREFLHADTWRSALGELSRRESSVSLGQLGLVAKDDLFVSSVMHLGLRSLQVLRPGGLDAVKDDILTINAKVRALNESVEAGRSKNEWDDWLLESPWVTIERDTMVTMYDDTPWEGEDMEHFLAAIR